MSGGAFGYEQYYFFGIADRLEELTNEPHGYSEETLEKFSLTVKRLRQAAEMVQRIDWLISGDDSEESFHKLWEEMVVPFDRIIDGGRT